ncbi:MAG: DNA alkylation repair protein [Candidatus Peribacteraceae bacterium]|nr:DNA alkylation repair protein [Candidatus Peribacteraceae bacterium]
MPSVSSSALEDLRAHANPTKAAFFPRFFKAGKGEYAEGDVFLGISVPEIRLIAQKYKALSLPELKALLADKHHEARLLALIILTKQYAKGNERTKAAIVKFYLSQFARVNNWDLVDSSASQILGTHLLTQKRAMLREFAKSKHLWTQRIAIIATHAFIRAGEFSDTLRISEIFLTHKHDLIHKAAGWMLREVGKRDIAVLRFFLDLHAPVMPRTMLRYAIEKMVPRERRKYLDAKKA